MYNIVRKSGQRCATCTPTSASAKRAHKEEEAVAKVLDAAGVLYQREVRIDFSCFTSHKKFARLDFVCEQKDRRVILEVDERQHTDQSYSIGCDVSRMLDVVAALVCDDNTRPTLWLRFNPNAYKVDGVRVHTSKKERYRWLLEILTAPTHAPSLVVRYMYYDVRQGRPVVTYDPDYSPVFAACIQS